MDDQVQQYDIEFKHHFFKIVFISKWHIVNIWHRNTKIVCRVSYLLWLIYVLHLMNFNTFSGIFWKSFGGGRWEGSLSNIAKGHQHHLMECLAGMLYILQNTEGQAHAPAPAPPWSATDIWIRHFCIYTLYICVHSDVNIISDSVCMWHIFLILSIQLQDSFFVELNRKWD